MRVLIHQESFINSLTVVCRQKKPGKVTRHSAFFAVSLVLLSSVMSTDELEACKAIDFKLNPNMCQGFFWICTLNVISGANF